MRVESVNPNVKSVQPKTKKIATIAGLGVAGVYLVKNRNDLFVNSVKEAADALEKEGIAVSKNLPKVITGGTCVLALGIGALAGKLTGVIAGKLIDRHNIKKAEKQQASEAAAQSIPEGIDASTIPADEIVE